MVAVVNLRKERCDVPVCRPTIYGNFLGYGNPHRPDAIEMFAAWWYSPLARRIRHKALVEIPTDAKLGCHCAPDRCHADIIAGYLNWRRNFKFDGPKARTVIYEFETID